jgi:hypothetical protein
MRNGTEQNGYGVKIRNGTDMGLKCGTERNGYGVKMRNGTEREKPESLKPGMGKAGTLKYGILL